MNPDDACQTCQASASDGWTNAADGSPCGNGQVCAGGQCGVKCRIDGTLFASAALDPANRCRSCQPGVSTSGWSTLATGTSCGEGQVCNNGACSSACFIAGSVYGVGGVSPTNTCQSCEPGASTTAWTAAADGTACGDGQICSGGACGTECDIGGSVHPSGAANPANACQMCQPGTSTTSWTAIGSGTICGPGEVCNATTCVAGCYVSGAFYASGAANPANTCERCQPVTTTSQWTASNGASCGVGDVCSGATCIAGCAIGGAVYVSGAANPANACETCQSTTSATAWTNLANGASCGANEFCTAGTCAPACSIGGVMYASGEPSPANACQSCQPSVSPSSFTNSVTGTSCGPGGACNAGVCSVTFAYTGAQQSFVVPAGVTQLTILAYGAAGGNNNDAQNPLGTGGSLSATISASAGATLALFVGGAGAGPSTGAACPPGYPCTPGAGGFNGGGFGGFSPYYSGDGGGGASDVRLGGSALANRILVAAGGGGGGGGGGGSGGAGGSTIGGNGTGGATGGTGGGGGTQSAGGGGAILRRFRSRWRRRQLCGERQCWGRRRRRLLRRWRRYPGRARRGRRRWLLVRRRFSHGGRDAAGSPPGQRTDRDLLLSAGRRACGYLRWDGTPAIV